MNFYFYQYGKSFLRIKTGHFALKLNKSGDSFTISNISTVKFQVKTTYYVNILLWKQFWTDTNTFICKKKPIVYKK